MFRTFNRESDTPHQHELKSIAGIIVSIIVGVTIKRLPPVAQAHVASVWDGDFAALRMNIVGKYRYR